jgi:hypothetical protein
MNLAALCGIVVLLGVAFFATANGERGSAKKVSGDQDLPKITSPAPTGTPGSP